MFIIISDEWRVKTETLIDLITEAFRNHNFLNFDDIESEGEYVNKTRKSRDALAVNYGILKRCRQHKYNTFRKEIFFVLQTASYSVLINA